METDLNQDFQDYWNEYKVLNQEEVFSEDENLKSAECEGTDEAQWLILAGLSHLTEEFLRGNVIDDADLESVVSVLSVHQVDAVRRRVDTLNQTVRQRTKCKHKKPDIRDVFKPFEVSKEFDVHFQNETTELASAATTETDSYFQPFVSLHEETYIRNIALRNNHDVEQRVPSPKVGPSVPKYDLFRKTAHMEGDIVASEDANGITMLGFQKLGTLRERPPTKYPKLSLDFKKSSPIPERSGAENRAEIRSDQLSMGFEHAWQSGATSLKGNEVPEIEEEIIFGRTWIDTLGEDDIKKLNPLFFVELSAIFDQSGVPLPKIKKPRRKKKHDNNVFGVPVRTLVERDNSTLVTDQLDVPQHVPMIYEKILGEIEKRGLNTEGILRVAGNKLKVDRLCQEIEKHFYQQAQEVDQILQRSSVHDLTAVFKKLLRDLPEPLLTTELIHLFYHSDRLPKVEKALNLLVLMLPPENRATLLLVLSFMRKLSSCEQFNKMNSHNVAMIVAPSLFPPRYLRTDKTTSGELKTEIEVAAVSCRLTEVMMRCKDRLDIVPYHLVEQLRQMNELSNLHSSEPGEAEGLFREMGEMKDLKKKGQVLLNEGAVVKISAPQFAVHSYPMIMDQQTAVGDAILRVTEIGMSYLEKELKITHIRRKYVKQKSSPDSVSPGTLSCLLTTADPDTALRTHFLYEIGGNIGQRRVESTSLMLAVYKQNQNARWVIRCDHRNAIRH